MRMTRVPLTAVTPPTSASARWRSASESFLQWFVDEQIEEEENARDIIDVLEKIGDNKYGLYEYDKELGARVYTTPSPLANAE